jgi:tetratricopeptide (TPR) repeat protein
MAHILEEADRLRNQGQSLEAAKKYQEIAESSDESQIVGAALHMSAVCFNQAKEHTKAEEYFTKAVEHYKKQSDKFNLARVQRDYGNCQMAQSKLDKAEELFNQSIKNFDNTSDLGELAMTQVKLAALHAKQEKFDEASSQVYEGIQNANKSNNRFYIATAYKEAGRVYFLAKKYQAMIDCLYAALGALQLDEDPHAKQHAELYLSLAHAYERLNNSDLFKSTQAKAEEYLKELDDESAVRIRSYFK